MRPCVKSFTNYLVEKQNKWGCTGEAGIHMQKGKDRNRETKRESEKQRKSERQ